MTLTVPRAGVVAGRAADIRIEPSGAAGAVAEFGEALFRIGSGLEQERLGREKARARIDMMTGLNDLRLEFEAIGDPDVLAEQWGPRSTGLREQLIGGLDPKLHADAGLMFDEMALGHATALGRQELALRQSQRRALLMQTEDTLVRTGAFADPDTRTAYLAQYRDELDELVTAGVLTPEQAQSRLMDRQSDMDATRAVRMLSEDPAGLIEAIDRGELADMAPERLQSFRARGVSAVTTEAARAEAEAKRARGEFLSSAKDALRDGRNVFQKAGAFARRDEIDALLEGDEELRATREAQEYLSARGLYDHMPEFATLPLAEKRDRLAEAEAAPKAAAHEFDLSAAMKDAIEAHENALKDDPYGFAAEIGLTEAAPLPDPAATSAEDMAEGFTRRRHDRDGLRAAGFADVPGQYETDTGDHLLFFRPDERAALKAQADPLNSPAARADLAIAMHAGFGDEVADAAAELGADPVFTHTAGLLVHGGPQARQTALGIFEGRRIRQDKDISLPGTADSREPWFENDVAMLFEDGTGPTGADERDARNTLMEAAHDLYAYKVRGNPDLADGRIDREIWLQSLHEVAGGTGTHDAGFFTRDKPTGGVQRLKGWMTILPPGISARDMEPALGAIEARLRGDGIAPEDWQALSVGGSSVPVIEGAPLDAATWRRTWLRAVGGDAYVLYAMNPLTGEAEVVADADGDPWRLDLRALTGPEGAR